MSEPPIDDTLAQGLRLEDKGDFQGALDLYQEARDRFPDEARLVHRVGVMYIRLDRRDDARVAFEQALEINKDFAPSLTNLGNMALESGDTDTAVRYYQRAIAAQPDYPGAHHNLGIAYRRMGKLSDAVASHRAATRHERRYTAEQDKLRLRGTGASGCLGRASAILFFLGGSAYLITRLHV